MQNLPLVSIVVLNWNGELVIRSSLDSIRKLDYPNLEVIVVDNGSTDTSVDIIRNEFPEFRLVKNIRNLGFSAGMNVGIQESQGDLILLYNNDAIAHPASLSEMVNTISLGNEIGIVGCLILYNEPNNVIWSRGGKLDLVTGTIWSDGLGQKMFAESHLEEKCVMDVDYVSGCVFLIRKEVIKKIGLLDDAYLIGGQDLDWCLRARRAGFKCVLNPSAIVWHIGSHASRQMPLKSYAERQKSDFRVIMLHFPLIAVFSALLFQLVIAPFFELFFFRKSDVAMRSRLRARVDGFRENLKDIVKIVSKRRRIATLGVLCLKARTLELLRFAVLRIGSKEFYMGKFLQKLESHQVVEA